VRSFEATFDLGVGRSPFKSEKVNWEGGWYFSGVEAPLRNAAHDDQGRRQRVETEWLGAGRRCAALPFPIQENGLTAVQGDGPALVRAPVASSDP
jgi:hypothetical protein